MYTKYFYLALTPTGNALAFIYSRPIKISYDDSSGIISQQNEFEKQFRAFNGNPLNYNAQWSSAYNDLNTADLNRTSEITALTNGGKVVKTPNWP